MYIKMNRDIELINKGILPDSLNYSGIHQNQELDLEKLVYNLRYKTTEYWESKNNFLSINNYNDYSKN
jgi:hypothetical protein